MPTTALKPRPRATAQGSVTAGRDVKVMRIQTVSMARSHAHQAAQEGQDHGLREELPEHAAPGGAQGSTDADLAGALGDAHQHDVGDADAAHDEGDAGGHGQEER